MLFRCCSYLKVIIVEIFNISATLTTSLKQTGLRCQSKPSGLERIERNTNEKENVFQIFRK